MPPAPIPTPNEPPGQGLAVAAEALYLVNLLLVPGAAFLALWVLYLKHAGSAPPLAANHLVQTFRASLWAGVLLVLANALILLLGGYQAPATWTVMVVYFTCCHSTLVIFGVLGLAKAMAGQDFRFPIIGPRLAGGAREP